MKRRLKALVPLIGLLYAQASSGLLGGAESAGAASSVVHQAFHEVDTLLANPGQGWMTQARTPKANPRFPYSVVYIRFNWADVEPEQGKYNWQVVDDVIAAWKSRGATVAFRVMTCNAHSAGYYSSPKWLFDQGCKGFEYLVGGDDPTSGGKRIPRIEPDYSDPSYLARHGEFLQALGQRYDGSASLEFLDIGSYGIWGEWHTSHPAPIAVRKQIVDLYLRAFRHTPMVFMSDDAEVLTYALAHGTGFRRDGVGSPWHEQNWIGSKRYAGVMGMAEAWQRAPVVFEWFGDYAYLQSKGWSLDAAVNFMLSNHVTLINDNIGRFPDEVKPQMERLARLAGARLVLREVTYQAEVNRGGILQFESRWANVGVGKLNHPYALRCWLVDPAKHSYLVLEAKTEVRQWLPGEHVVIEPIQVSAALEPGDYDLMLGFVDPSGTRRPFLLAIDAPQKDGLYTVGHIKIR